MIGLDTNILLRYLLQDDPLQSPEAVRLIEDNFDSENPGYVSLVTVLEVFWAITNVYKLPREHIVWVMRQMLLSRTLQFQNEREVLSALTVFEAREGGFPDALIAALGLWSGCTHTVTFDRKASRLPGMKLI